MHTKNVKLLGTIRAIAAQLSKKPKEVYIKNMHTPVLKYIWGIAQNERISGWIFMYGNGLVTDLNEPEFVVDIFINNDWEEVTKSNFKRINEIILNK